MAAPQVSRAGAAAFLALTLALGAVPAYAQNAPTDPSALSKQQRDKVGTLLTHARSAYEAKNYLEAIGALQQAYGILADPNILYRIGDAYENLGDLDHAVEFYRKYVAAAPNASDAGLVKRRIEDLERRTAELRKRLHPAPPARAALLLDSNPAGAHVSVDAKTQPQKTPVRVEVAPGKHHVELRRAGFKPIERDIEIDSGETISLVYQLSAVPPPPKSASGPGPWILGGFGVAALGTGIGLFVASIGPNKQVKSWDEARNAAYANGTPVPDRPAEYDSKKRTAYILHYSAVAAGAAGVLGVFGGITWLLLRHPHYKPKVSLRVGPGAIGIVAAFR